ncbi:MAG: FmdB family zinc ribbon protein [Chloroflexota bacterium]
MPKYDFRCDDCGYQFELTRSFGQAAAPAACPHDGAPATRLFSPPLDVLVYGREPVVSTGRVTIPPGALSCHDHGPPPDQASAEDAERSGSRWHARGYEPAPDFTHSHGTYSHAHAHGRGRPHDH